MSLLAKLSMHRKALTIAGVFLMALALAPAAHAQLGSEDDPFGVQQTEDALGGRLGGGDVDFIESVVGVINILLGLLGLVAVIIILMGGFKWMTAGGNDEKVTEARKLIFSGIIGLAIILSAWAIARFVIGSLQEATGAGTGTSGGF